MSLGAFWYTVNQDGAFAMPLLLTSGRGLTNIQTLKSENKKRVY